MEKFFIALWAFLAYYWAYFSCAILFISFIIFIVKLIVTFIKYKKIDFKIVSKVAGPILIFNMVICSFLFLLFYFHAFYNESYIAYLLNLYNDSVPIFWSLISILLFMPFLIVFFVTLIVAIAKYRKTHSKLVLKTTIPILILSALMMYQVLPAQMVVNTYARETDYFKSKTQENKNKVIKEYKKIIFLSIIPHQKSDLYLRLANFTLKYDGGMEKAEKYYKKAKISDRKYKNLEWSLFGFYHYMNKDFDKAIKIFEGVEHYNRLAMCYIFKNDIETALKYVNKDLNKKPTGVNSHIARSYIYEKLGKNELAREDLENALKYQNEKLKMDKKAKELPFGYGKKAYILKKLGKTKEAQRNYEIALSKCENNMQKETIKAQYNDGFIEGELKGMKMFNCNTFNICE